MRRRAQQKGTTFMKSVVWMGVVLLVVSGLWAGVQPVAVTNADESYPYPSPFDTPVPETVIPTEIPTVTATPDAIAPTSTTDGAESNQEIAPTSDDDVAAEPTPSPTATVPTTATGAQIFACTSGSTLVIQGTTTADTLLVLYFSGRAVSAALSDHNGWYAFHVRMGLESAGFHPLEVIKRDTGKLLATHFCKIP